MRPRPTHRWDRETTLVSQLSAGASLLAFLFYFRHGDLLLYGDAVAHINIARRVFDSQTPGLLQLGTVWLPLPHLLMIPFLFSASAWQTGIGGAVPSVCAYVLGTTGVFRLVRGALSFSSEPEPEARIAAWMAAIIYAANPNLLYLQTTAMTEALYLALFIWTVVHFSEFVQALANSDTDAAGSSLVKCGLCLAGACLTRYDGWFLAGAAGPAVSGAILRWRGKRTTLRFAFAKFVLLTAAAPVVWLGYNAIIYRNPLEFANGPYSAKAIEQKSATAGQPGHPGSNDLPVAFSYFLKSAEMNMAEGGLQRFWVALLVTGTFIVLVVDLRLWPLLMLWALLPFYVLSVAYGGVPIFVPAWWPFSYYNARYGIELLPAFAVFTAITIYFALRRTGIRSARIALGLAPVLLLVASYGLIWRSQPICYREAWINSRSRIALETELAATLSRLPHDSTLLMYLGDHVGALQRAAFPLKRTINEGNHRPWMKPADSQGLWERALADPQRYVDYVVAMNGDPVATGVEKRDLSDVVVIRTIGQPAATLYWTHRPLR
ncbi:MAG: hypothetical protein WB952_18050 [Terriglobales bacterium]